MRANKPVAEQMKLRDRFNGLLSNALKGIATSDRVIGHWRTMPSFSGGE